MTQAVSVRRDGDTFQARLFWKAAIRMLDPVSSIQRVGFEYGPKSFDDVWVEHFGPNSPIDHEGRPITREHTQCKWHVAPGQYGYLDIIDPEFINASSKSLLQRAREAQVLYAPDGVGCRFRLYTTHRINCDDALCSLIHRRVNNLRLDRMWEGKTRNSASGGLRHAWATHLGITEEALRLLARTLVFTETTESLADLRETLNDNFQRYGLRTVLASESSFPYDEIVFAWLAQGRNVFDRAGFYDACKREGLLSPPTPAPFVFGVKSFEHPTDALEDRCVRVLSLLPDFYTRQIRPESDWSLTIYPKLKQFLLEVAKEHTTLRLALDAHITLAVAAGSVLNVKSGRTIELEQRTNGRHIWSPNDSTLEDSWSRWAAEEVEQDAEAQDIVVTVGITTDPWPMVEAFLQHQHVPYRLRMSLLPTHGTGGFCVKSGSHATALAEDLIQRIAVLRSTGKFSGTVHLFMAVPNVFSFFLGQRISRVGAVTLYEYDFEGLNGASYEASLSLPVLQA
jgi:SMODS-associated and fused to various effectors sensor domain